MGYLWKLTVRPRLKKAFQFFSLAFVSSHPISFYLNAIVKEVIAIGTKNEWYR